MHRLLIVCTVALMCMELFSCGSNDSIEESTLDGERVLSISIDPANPAPGELVKVTVDQCITGGYPSVYGGGPTYTFRASDGVLIYFLEDITPEPVYGTEVQAKARKVEWQLPDEPGKYWIEASLKDGGKKLVVDVN